MVTTFVRILKYGVQSFWRNGWLTVATILVLVLAVLVFQGLIMFSVITKNAVASIQNKIDISVTFKPTTAEDDILKVERALESLAEVKSVEYISRDKALALFKEQHKDNPIISEALGSVDENPLLASLNIKAGKLEYYQKIAEYLETANLRDFVAKVTYTQSRTAIERLDKIIATFQRIGLGLTIFLAFAAALVTFNTVRLAIYSNREEISIMRLVGASNIFIRGPYIIEGMFYGIVAALVGILISIPFIISVSPYANVLIPELNLKLYLYSNLFALLGYQLLFSIGLGAVSSAVAVRRYLRT
jgi:cell division transport system permease protein